MLAQVIDAASDSTAQVITSIATVITALGGIVLAFAVLLPIFRNSKAANEKMEKVDEQVATIHTIVNQQQTDLRRYNIALSQALKKAGIEVPIDQSLPVPGVSDAQPGQPT